MKKIFAILFLITCSLITKAQIITTIAGTGSHAHTGDGGPATAASIGQPYGCAFDSHNNFYFTDCGGGSGFWVRKITPCGIISTVAGTRTAGYNGDSIAATAAELSNPYGITFDSFDNLYIADGFNNRIRKVDAITGIITTVAGNGTPGFGGDSGSATSAMLHYPNNVCFDRFGNLYISDATNERIRKVNVSGIITTFAGTGTPGYTGDGGHADSAEIENLYGICTDTIGNIYFTQFLDVRVRKVDISGIITTIAGNGTGIVSGDSGPATNAGIGVFGLAFDRLGNLFISGYLDNDIRKVNDSGIISTVVGNGTQGFSGDGGLADTAELYAPYGITINSYGNLYIADDGNSRIRKVIFHSDSSCGNNSDTTHTDTTNAVQNVKSGGFSVYPNPATAEITITGNSINSVHVINMLGQVVYDKTFVQQKRITIDISALPNGVYFIKVNPASGGTSVQKVIKE